MKTILSFKKTPTISELLGYKERTIDWIEESDYSHSEDNFIIVSSKNILSNREDSISATKSYWILPVLQMPPFIPCGTPLPSDV